MAILPVGTYEQKFPTYCICDLSNQTCVDTEGANQRLAVFSVFYSG
jgi:hypothetical protein